MRKYRILSLDGGGSWSIIQIKALKRLFGDVPGREILSKFDLVAGNSGGSIVAAGLAENMRPSELENLFLNPDTRNNIYSRLRFREFSFLNRITKPFHIGPRYSSRRKLEAFQELLPEVSSVPMHELPALVAQANDERTTHFLVVAFDYHRNRAKFFRSNYRSKSRTSYLIGKLKEEQPIDKSRTTITQAIHASSNAPLNYFDEPAQLSYDDEEACGGYCPRYWDGAIGGYNNPVLAAVTEALSNGVKTENMEVLSIGTGFIFLPLEGSLPATQPWLTQKMQKPSFIEDVLKISTSILGDPPDAATFVSYTFIHPDLPSSDIHFVRLNPAVQPVMDDLNGVMHWTIPEGFTPEEFKQLMEMDLDATSDEEIVLLAKLADQWLTNAIPNQPIRNDAFLNCVIGHTSFNIALRDLRQWEGENFLNELPL